MSSLYDHTEQLLGLLDAEQLAENQEEREAAAAAIAQQLDLTRDKIDRVAGELATLDHAAGACEAERGRLAKRQAAIEAQALSLKKHTIAAFERARTRKMAGNTHSLSLRYNTPAVDVLDPEAVPAKYKLHEVVERTSIDKRAIKAVMATGEFVPGVRLTQTISLLRS